MAMEELPGLMAAGMRSIGRFGIGFFSIFMLGSVVRVYSRRCDKGKDTGRLLEFRDGTSTRPILVPGVGKTVPIDGGTRIEVKLKKDPTQSGGLLAKASLLSSSISLESLLGSVAPNLDVTIVTMSDKGQHIVAEPGDWLNMNQSELLGRLDPETSGPKEQSDWESKALMQPVEDSSGTIYGRAFISPSRIPFLSGKKGWVTVSGLRASSLRNVSGILLGEAITASRNSARPIATADAISAWASKQAELIAHSTKDEKRQAQSAEIVLECGGSIGQLKIVRWGPEWMTEDEFESRLRSTKEFAVSFDGDFDYDEDEDDVHPREFREGFEVLEDVVVVERYDGGILRLGNVPWPKTLFSGRIDRNSNLSAYVRLILERVWGSFEEIQELRVVGNVADTEIVRMVTHFRSNSHYGILSSRWPKWHLL